MKQNVNKIEDCTKIGNFFKKKYEDQNCEFPKIKGPNVFILKYWD